MPLSPEFSIIIPTYNRLKFLRQALDSIWTQTIDDYEIIVVDDGSTDGTRNYLMSLGGRVRVVRHSRGGPGAARNQGVKQAKGEYIAFLDSDDIWSPWALATYHNLIRRHKPSLICAAVSEFETKLPKFKQGPIFEECFTDYFATANDYIFVGASALVVQRDAFLRESGFAEKMLAAEDHDFCMRIGTSSRIVRVQSPVTLAYRRHPANMSKSLHQLYCGATELLKRESEGRYPGGPTRTKERWQLLSRTVRPVMLSCVKAGLRREAWLLYRQSFRMNARLGKFGFLVGFLLCSLHDWVTGQSSKIKPT